MCGGNKSLFTKVDAAEGPSPRVRGKRKGIVLQPVGAGSIPACAGETSNEPRLIPDMRVHPRVCGGNYENHMVHHVGEGPSPRVRGKLW